MNISLILKRLGATLVILSLISFATGCGPNSAESGSEAAVTSQLKFSAATQESLMAKIAQDGSARVIVGLASAAEPDAAVSGPQTSQPTIANARRASIGRLQSDTLRRLNSKNIGKVKQFANIPYLALEVDDVSLKQLLQLREVVTIEEDKLQRYTLTTSIPLIGADTAWAAGYSGAGQAVAVLDTGVDSAHTFLAGKVISEACFSTTNASQGSSTACPNGLDTQIGTGAGVNCDVSIAGCTHGTHVAGIAAGTSASFSGVAKDGNLIAIQVFSIFDNPLYCGVGLCVLSWNSDTIAGLDHVFSLSGSINIAAVNLSLGGGFYSSEATCDASNVAYKAAIDNLRTVDIATVAASGNDGYTTGMGAPGCISTAVSVGATDDFDNVASFSNSVSFLEVLAPGVNTYSSIPGGGFQNKSGTSMATPHTAGAWAVLKSAAPAATVDEVLTALTSTGVPILDTRNGLTFPRIQVDAAANDLVGGAPLAIGTTSLPNGMISQAYSETLSATGGTPPYSWSIVAGSLPTGLTLNPASGVISGIPSTAGTANFTVQVQDSVAATSTQPLAIIIDTTPNLIISADNTEDVYLNGVYLGRSRDWQQSTAYSTAIQDGPNVLAVKALGTVGSASGLIAQMNWGGLAVSDSAWKVSTVLQTGWQQVGFDDSAWPAATSYGTYGVAPWLESVTGFPGGSLAQWIWSADNMNDDVVYFRYTFTVVSIPLAVNTTTSPNGTAGEHYSHTLAASGGEPPYYWSVISGSLPDGLNLDPALGVISGYPTTGGISSFTVQVQDNLSSTATQALSITVADAPLNIIISADDIDEIYVNGVLLGSSSNWLLASNYKVPLQSGTNVIAVKATDANGSVGGLIADLAWGAGNTAVSNSTWKASTVLQAGWELPGFDDSAWPAATSYGTYGVAPWLQSVRRFPVTSPAEWIWSADNVADDEVYFRYVIVVP